MNKFMIFDGSKYQLNIDFSEQCLLMNHIVIADGNK